MAVFWPITGEPEFCQIWDCCRNISNNISFHFRLFPRKTNVIMFQKIQKSLIWGHFGLFLPKFGQKWIFLKKKSLSVFRYSNYLPSCQKSEKKLLGPFWEKRQTDGRTDRQTDRQTGRQTDRQTDRQADRQTDRERLFYRTLRRTGVQ